MEKRKLIFFKKMIPSHSNKSKKKEINTNYDPYVLYKLDGKYRKAKAILENIEKNNSQESIHKHIKKISKYGTQCKGKHLSELNTGNIVIKSKDGLYAIYKEKETNSLYLLMFLEYEKIKKGLNKINK